MAGGPLAPRNTAHSGDGEPEDAPPGGRSAAVTNTGKGRHEHAVTGHVRPPAEVQILVLRRQPVVRVKTDPLPDLACHEHRARRDEQHFDDAVVLPVVELTRSCNDVKGCPNRSVERPTSRRMRGSSQSTTLGPAIPVSSTLLEIDVSTKRSIPVSGSRAVSSWTTSR